MYAAVSVIIFQTVVHVCLFLFELILCVNRRTFKDYASLIRSISGFIAHIFLSYFSFVFQLQGSLKRKQIVNPAPANSKRPNGFVDNSFLDIKRIRVGENLSAGQGGLHVNNGQSQIMSGTLPMSQAPLRKTSTLPPHTHSPGNGMFNMGLKEVKKEPGETLSCSKHMDGQMTQENIFSNRYGDDPGEQLMDPELQELFNELTNISVPSI